MLVTMKLCSRLLQSIGYRRCSMEAVICVPDCKQPTHSDVRTVRVRRRVISRRKLIRKRKYWYTVKPVGSFLGWPSQTDTETPSEFHGFTKGSIKHSQLRLQQTLAYSMSDGDDLVNHPTTVTSISLGSEGHVSTMKVVPVKRKILTVLSLFDGISGAYHVIHDRLKISTKYFASEVDYIARKVSQERYPGNIVQLGDVRFISKDTLAAIGHIDLLIGGSPCQDFSLVNPNRKEFEPDSSGQLLFNFVEIRDTLLKQAGQEGRPFFFCYENTAHCKKSVKERMTKALGVEAAVICQSSLTPTRRRRNYFSNIPGIHELAAKLSMTQTDKTLQDFVGPYHLATRMVARTITSNASNQQRPLMCIKDNKLVNPSVRNLEMWQGLPPGYTDCGITNCQRKRLLSNGFSIDVLAEILKPLKEMYLCRNE